MNSPQSSLDRSPNGIRVPAGFGRGATAPLPIDELGRGDTVANGRFVIEALIGRDRSWSVFEACDSQTSAHVTLKVLGREALHDPEASQRADVEVRLASAVGPHPNLVRIEGRGVLDSGRPFLVAEALRGPTVEQILGVERGIEPLRASIILLDVARGLSALHRAGVVHRDVEPAHVHVEGERAKLSGFGSAALAGAGLPSASHGPAPGHAHYVAPEQALGATPDVRADIYAFGAMAYEMLTGRRTGDEFSPRDIVRRKCRDDLPPLGFGGPHPPLPDTLVRLVDACLARLPGERPPSAETLIVALDGIVRELGGEPASPEPSPSSPSVVASETAARPSAWRMPEVGVAIDDRGLELPRGASWVMPDNTPEPAPAERSGLRSILPPEAAANSVQRVSPPVSATVPMPQLVASVAAAPMPVAAAPMPVHMAPNEGAAAVVAMPQPRRAPVAAPSRKRTPWLAPFVLGLSAAVVGVAWWWSLSSVYGEEQQQDIVAELQSHAIADEPGKATEWLAPSAVAKLRDGLPEGERSPAAEGEPSPSPAAEGEPSPSPTAEGEPSPSPTAEGEPSPSPTAEGEPSSASTAAAEPSGVASAKAEPTPAAVAKAEPIPAAEPNPPSPHSGSSGPAVPAKPKPTKRRPEPSANETGPSKPSATTPKPAEPSSGTAPIDCEQVRNAAVAARNAKQWTSVLERTATKKCWSSHGSMRVELRTKAFFEIGQFKACVREGENSSDPKVQSVVRWCRDELGA